MPEAISAYHDRERVACCTIFERSIAVTSHSSRSGHSAPRRAGLLVTLGGLTLLVLLLALTVLPLLLGTVADAQHVYLDQVPEANHGAFLISEQGATQLHDWHLPLAKAPSDAPVLVASDLQVLSVVMKQLDQATACTLFHLESGAVISWQASWRDGRQLLLDPGPLPAGDYLLAIPTDDVFGGKTYHYFRLQ